MNLANGKRISIDTESYNARRYGKPWIANVKLNQTRDKIVYDFGNWLGSAGDKGILLLDVTSPVWARGQSDNRGNNGGVYFYLAETAEKIDRVHAFKVLIAALDTEQGTE